MIASLPKQYRFDLEGPLEAYCPDCKDWGPESESTACPTCNDAFCIEHTEDHRARCRGRR